MAKTPKSQVARNKMMTMKLYLVAELEDKVKRFMNFLLNTEINFFSNNLNSRKKNYQINFINAKLIAQKQKY